MRANILTVTQTCTCIFNVHYAQKRQENMNDGLDDSLHHALPPSELLRNRTQLFPIAYIGALC